MQGVRSSEVKDPLWTRICADLASMMGSSFVPKIRVCKLGVFHPSTKSIDLYYQTEEVGDLLKQFDHVILGMLHRYFPSLEDIRIQDISSK